MDLSIIIDLYSNKFMYKYVHNNNLHFEFDLIKVLDITDKCDNMYIMEDFFENRCFGSDYTLEGDMLKVSELGNVYINCRKNQRLTKLKLILDDTGENI